MALLALVAAQARAVDPFLQLDASNAGTLNLSGTSVESWTNAAGAQTFTPVADAPVYVPNAINGHAAIDFMGNNELQNMGFGGTHADLTFFLVVAPHSNQGDYRAFLSDRTGSDDDYTTGFNIDQTSSGSSSFDRVNVEGVKGGGNGGVTLGTGGFAFDTFHILEVTYTSPRTSIYVDGNLAGTRDGNGNAVPLDNVLVGGRYFNNPPAPPGGYAGMYDGQIAEVRIYDGALSDADRMGVTAELQQKYFAAVPEPSSLAALALGGLALIGRRRRAR